MYLEYMEKIFVDVVHTGYTYDTRAGLYNIHVECTLAESVGRNLEATEVTVEPESGEEETE